MKAPDVVIDEAILTRRALDPRIAFTMYIRAWRERNGYQHLHPAIQAAIEDAYCSAHLQGGTQTERVDPKALLPRAFALNYEYRARVWDSNVSGRQWMTTHFPVVPTTTTVQT